MAKTLRVGLLTAVDKLDPRQPPESVGSSLLLQVFEPSFSLQHGAVVQVHSLDVTRFTPSAFGRVPLGEVDLQK